MNPDFKALLQFLANWERIDLGMRRNLALLKTGQMVTLAGSGPALVEETWQVGGCYFGRFRCSDGLVVMLTEAEEEIIS